MCDEFTEGENSAYLKQAALSRRGFAVLGAGAASALVLPGCVSAKEAARPAAAKLAERTVAIATADGNADGFFVHPAKGRHPAVLMWPDVAGLREAYRTLARRLAQEGFAVLAINHYYRSSPAPIVERMDEWRTPAGQAKIGPMRQALTPAAVERDAASFVAWLDGQAHVDRGRGIGTNGYCMTGPYTIRTAAAAPGRVRAAASFHGGGLVSEAPESPHLLIPRTRASYLFAIAQNDDAREPETKTVLRQTCEAAGRPADVEVFPAQHGWCTPDAAVYDPVQQARAWARMLALFRAL